MQDNSRIVPDVLYLLRDDAGYKVDIRAIVYNRSHVSNEGFVLVADSDKKGVGRFLDVDYGFGGYVAHEDILVMGSPSTADIRKEVHLSIYNKSEP